MRSLLLVCIAAQAAAIIIPSIPQTLTRTTAVSRCPSQLQMKQVVRIEVEVEQGEPLEKALRRFRKATNMCGHLRILRNRRMFESTHDKKIRKNKESLMRRARARRAMRG